MGTDGAGPRRTTAQTDPAPSLGAPSLGAPSLEAPPLEAPSLEGPSLEDLADEELLRRALRADEPWRERLLGELYRRYYSKVARWCARVCGNRVEAAELAQEVFLRVHRSIDSYRFESRFATWLYTVTRNTAINRGIAARRSETDSLDENVPEPAVAEPPAEERLDLSARSSWLRRTMREALEPLEARVTILHFVHGMSLPAITELLHLDNRSGAKAYVVAAKRKLLRAWEREAAQRETHVGTTDRSTNP